MTSSPVESPRRPVDAVIFDWGGTLTPWHDVDLRQQWVEFARGYGTMACSLNELTGRLLTAEDELWRRSRTTHESGRIAELLAGVGLDPDGEATRAGLAAYERFWEQHTVTDPQVLPLWEGLRERGIKVGVLSNTIWTRDYHRAVFARDGVEHLLDGDVYSSEIAWAKPHPEAFLAAARAVGVAPERCVYVGDRSFEDVHGPHQVGMRAIWVPHSRIPVAQQVAHDAEPDAVARELLDVLAIVDAWRAGPAPRRRADG
ncbi:HAD family hydrolase [Arsenicicoccus dermatophilus]|uniref:HAD family hydrolase n=1 Tax=Arsenicicoccus dermatophilus TaxID=1076331 RepID=UPI001F4CD8D3|nr:HAD family hydrolase [Arsenicicoccus dermatophilus]MCH8612867.1 HAD family hydrolase [Arsenicicoccus dermatophilus]